MTVNKLITYVQVDGGWQTYLHPTSGGFIRYKFLKTPTQLESAINQCKQAGWKIVNATSIVKKFNSVTSKRYHR